MWLELQKKNKLGESIIFSPNHERFYLIMFIFNFNHNIKTYTNNIEKIYINRPNYCPSCGCHHEFHLHGSYERIVIYFNKEYRIKIYRFKCPNKNCNKTTSALPSFLIPYRQYSYAVILFTLYQAFVKEKNNIAISKISKGKLSRQLVCQLKKRFLLLLSSIIAFFTPISIDRSIIVKSIYRYKMFNFTFYKTVRLPFMVLPKANYYFT